MSTTSLTTHLTGLCMLDFCSCPHASLSAASRHGVPIFHLHGLPLTCMFSTTSCQLSTLPRLCTNTNLQRINVSCLCKASARPQPLSCTRWSDRYAPCYAHAQEAVHATITPKQQQYGMPGEADSRADEDQSPWKSAVSTNKRY